MRLVIAIALFAALSACSTEPTPKEPAATAATPAPTLTPPPMPAQAKEAGPEGASAFTKFWVDTLNYASNTGDVAPLEAITDMSCRGCQSYIDLYRETYAAGGYFKDGFWSLGDLDVMRRSGETYVTSIVDIDTGFTRPTSLDPEQQEPGNSEKISFAMTPSADSWVMTQLGLGEVQ